MSMLDCRSDQPSDIWGEGMDREQAVRVQYTISRIPGIIEEAKRRRGKFAFVMQLHRDEYCPPFSAAPDAELELDWLRGAARQVFEWCKREGYEPTIETVGWAANTHICAHWK